MKSKVPNRIKELFPKNTEQTQMYMTPIISSLIKRDGELKADYLINLVMLANYVETYLAAIENIREKGLIQNNRFDVEIINPCVKISNDASIQIQKISDKFALSPMTFKRLVSGDGNDDEDDVIAKLLED